MILGAALSWDGLGQPGVKTGITFSVLVASIFIATLGKLTTAVGGTLIGASAQLPRFAQGAEMPKGVTLAAYLVGFSIATLELTLLVSGLETPILKGRRLSYGGGCWLAWGRRCIWRVPSTKTSGTA